MIIINADDYGLDLKQMKDQLDIYAEYSAQIQKVLSSGTDMKLISYGELLAN